MSNSTVDLQPARTQTALTFGLVGFALLLVMFLRDFGIILDLTGGVTGSAINFIFPALAYLRTHPGSWHAGALMLLAFGLAVLVATVVITFSRALG